MSAPAFAAMAARIVQFELPYASYQDIRKSVRRQQGYQQKEKNDTGEFKEPDILTA